MKPASVVLVLAAIVAGLPVCHGQQPARSNTLTRAQGAAISDSAVSDAANVNVSPALSDAALNNLANRNQLDTALTNYRISSEAVDEGKVVAVLDGRSQQVTRASLVDQVNAGALFVEQVRPAPIEQAAPELLRQGLRALPGIGGENALKLSFQISVPMSGGSAAKLDAWAKEGNGLMLDGEKKAYEGTFYVALSNAQDPSDRTPLSPPTPIAISAVGYEAIDPDPLSIAPLSAWQKVSIMVSEPAGESYPVSVSADPSSPGDTVELTVTRPTITLTPRSDSLVGWGIGHTVIDVHATNYRHSEGQRIQLRGTGGVVLEPITLDADGDGSTRLRSTRAESTQITVVQPQARFSALTVSFGAPWIFLGSAAAGGLVGAFLRGRGRKRWPKALLIGVVTAVVMVLGYAVGIDWTSKIPGLENLAVSGEAVVFILGIIAALAGISFFVKVPSSDQ